MLVVAALLVFAGIWLNSQVRLQHTDEATRRQKAEVARVRAAVARKVAKHPSAAFVVRQAIRSGGFGAAQEAGLRKAFDASVTATKATGAVRSALNDAFFDSLRGEVAGAVATQPEKWQSRLAAYAARLDQEAKDALSSSRIPEWLAPISGILPFVAWAAAAIFGLIGVVRLAAAATAGSAPARLSGFPGKAKHAPFPRAESAAAAAPRESAPDGSSAGDASGAHPQPSRAVASSAEVAAAAVEAIRLDYEKQIETLRAERNEARRQLLLVQGQMEELEKSLASGGAEQREAELRESEQRAVAAAARAAGAAEESRQRAEDAERKINELLAHVRDLEEALKQSHFRAQATEMRAEQLAKEVEDLEETLFTRSAELRDARRALSELREALNEGSAAVANLAVGRNGDSDAAPVSAMDREEVGVEADAPPPLPTLTLGPRRRVGGSTGSGRTAGTTRKKATEAQPPSP